MGFKSQSSIMSDLLFYSRPGRSSNNLPLALVATSNQGLLPYNKTRQLILKRQIAFASNTIAYIKRDRRQEWLLRTHHINYKNDAKHGVALLTTSCHTTITEIETCLGTYNDFSMSDEFITPKTLRSVSTRSGGVL